MVPLLPLLGCNDEFIYKKEAMVCGHQVNNFSLDIVPTKK
jgi:hypothetical protein